VLFEYAWHYQVAITKLVNALTQLVDGAILHRGNVRVKTLIIVIEMAGGKLFHSMSPQA
jgi:hypothetical protein